MPDLILVLGACVIFFAGSIWAGSVRREMLEAHHRRGGDDLLLQEAARDGSLNPFRVMWETPNRIRRVVDLTSASSADAEIESLRRRYVIRRRIWLLGSVLMLAALAIVLGHFG